MVALLGAPVLVRVDRQDGGRGHPAAAAGGAAERAGPLRRRDRKALEALAAAAVEQELPARAQIITEGDEADALWILVRGSLAVRARGDGGEPRSLPPVQAPAYVGELGLLNDIPRTASVRTREPSLLLRIEAADFRTALAATSPSASLMTLAGTRLARTTPRPEPAAGAGGNLAAG